MDKFLRLFQVLIALEFGFPRTVFVPKCGRLTGGLFHSCEWTLVKCSYARWAWPQPCSLPRETRILAHPKRDLVNLSVNSKAERKTKWNQTTLKTNILKPNKTSARFSSQVLGHHVCAAAPTSRPIVGGARRVNCGDSQPQIHHRQDS